AIIHLTRIAQVHTIYLTLAEYPSLRSIKSPFLIYFEA
ncbi:hypothetical protein AZ030_000235, partial [Escherichia coli]